MISLHKMGNEILDNMNKLIALLEIDRLIKIVTVNVTHLNNCRVWFILNEGILTEVEVNRINIVLSIMDWNLPKLGYLTFFMEKRGPNQYWIKRTEQQVFCDPQDFDHIKDLLKLTADGVELTHYHLKHN